MNYVKIPYNIERVKNKIIFGLTLRQIICFALAAIACIPFYLYARKLIGNELSMFFIITFSFIFFFFAFYEKNGLPFEKYLFYKLNFKLIKKIRKKG